MARNGRGTFRPKRNGSGGTDKQTMTSKNAGKRATTMVPIYAMDDLPESVMDVLKALYPQSRHL